MRAYIVAAFANEPFRGNPAGVCILDRTAPRAVMQKMASELQQPETAFVLKVEDGWLIRWFSPAVEVDLCGHATLAAAHVLWQEGFVPRGETLNFIAESSLLQSRLDDAGRVWLNFPSFPGELAQAPADVLACVDNPPHLASRHGSRWLLEYNTAAEVRALKPDFVALAQTGIRSLIVTARSDLPDFDIVSRNFAPVVGVNEDYVTGVAHTCLAAYWASRLGSEMRCWQASSRPGALIVRTVGTRVELGGSAVIEFAGDWVASQAVVGAV